MKVLSPREKISALLEASSSETLNTGAVAELLGYEDAGLGYEDTGSPRKSSKNEEESLVGFVANYRRASIGVSSTRNAVSYKVKPIASDSSSRSKENPNKDQRSSSSTRRRKSNGGDFDKRERSTSRGNRNIPSRSQSMGMGPPGTSARTGNLLDTKEESRRQKERQTRRRNSMASRLAPRRNMSMGQRAEAMDNSSRKRMTRKAASRSVSRSRSPSTGSRAPSSTRRPNSTSRPMPGTSSSTGALRSLLDDCSKTQRRQRQGPSATGKSASTGTLRRLHASISREDDVPAIGSKNQVWKSQTMSRKSYMVGSVQLGQALSNQPSSAASDHGRRATHSSRRQRRHKSVSPVRYPVNAKGTMETDRQQRRLSAAATMASTASPNSNGREAAAKYDLGKLAGSSQHSEGYDKRADLLKRILSVRERGTEKQKGKQEKGIGTKVVSGSLGESSSHGSITNIILPMVNGAPPPTRNSSKGQGRRSSMSAFGTSTTTSSLGPRGQGNNGYSSSMHNRSEKDQPRVPVSILKKSPSKSTAFDDLHDSDDSSYYCDSDDDFAL